MSQKRRRSTSPPKSSQGLYWSSVIEDRGSFFKAVYTTTASRDHLHALPEFQGATHRISAWRQPSRQRSITADKPVYTSGHDDDGERYAGQKLEKLIIELNAEGVLMVARWYGGVLLGPVRFTHILDCAREAIRSWKQAEAETHKRRRTLEEEKEQKPKLVALLTQRDRSIAVLRGLLAEKQGIMDGQTKSNAPSAESKAGPDYEAMELQKLKGLEKVRDATIGFILVQIEKAEKVQEGRGTESPAIA
ncbi:MAG: hypothetical protein MMC23_002076 [Stictis urceolatum]|nr:hypothetical protein [Stictis urceolata]